MASISLGESKIGVLVVEDSRIYSRLLCDALAQDRTLAGTPFDPDTQQLLTAVSDRSVDVLILSSKLDGIAGRGIAVLRDLHMAVPSLRSLVLLDSDDDATVVNAFRAGARGVFSKREPIDLLSRCIHCIYDGEIWANSKQIRLALAALAASPTVRAFDAKGADLLSKRELQVVRYLAEGLTNQEIADRLKLSRHTVKNYLFRMFDKLGVSSRVELLFMTMSATSGIPVATTSGAREKRRSGDGVRRRLSLAPKKEAEIQIEKEFGEKGEG